jgi:hypothetical protein
VPRQLGLGRPYSGLLKTSILEVMKAIRPLGVFVKANAAALITDAGDVGFLRYGLQSFRASGIYSPRC